jgi:3-deoxy-manno-octulosonate cytidylyltransferase (CMP-KDO synthetase)
VPGAHPRQDAARTGWRHLGLYGYRRAVLERFLGHEPTPLELREGLEQLRLLEMGETIVVGTVEATGPGVDTPEDLAMCRQWLAGNAGA